MAKILIFEIPENEYQEFNGFLKMALEEMKKSREKMEADQAEIERLNKSIEKLRIETAEYKSQSDEILRRLEAGLAQKFLNMWKDLIEFAKAVFFLQRDTQQNKEDIKKSEQNIEKLQQDLKEIRKEFANLTVMVERLLFELNRVSEREINEREKLVLKLENEMLKFERRLPTGKDAK